MHFQVTPSILFSYLNKKGRHIKNKVKSVTVIKKYYQQNKLK